MNTLGSNIIEYIFSFINFENVQDMKECRIVCKSINNVITRIYFERVWINFGRIYHATIFMNFINKYKLYINAKNVINMEQLNDYTKLCTHSKMFKSIIFHNNFNNEIIINFPQGLQNLTFGWDFSQKIINNIFPESLTSLTFGYCFNMYTREPLLKFFPLNLKKLKFGGMSNIELLPNILPYGLIRLEFGEEYTSKCSSMFNREIKENVIPSTVEYLLFGENFNQNLNETNLPTNLKVLILSNKYFKKILLGGFNKITYNKSFDMYQKIGFKIESLQS
jgi:hypothetical protein